MGGQLEIGLGAVVEGCVEASSVRIDRVVAAPEDAVVGGDPEVVELVGPVAEPLPPLPSDGAELVLGEGLGRQGVVVDGHRVQPHAPYQGREDVRAQRDMAGQHAAVRRADGHAGSGAGQFETGRVLVDPYPEVLAGPLQPPGEPGRVEHGDTPPVPEAAQERRRVDLRAHRVAVQEVQPREAGRGRLLVQLAEIFELMGLRGDGDVAGALEVAVDGVALDGRLDAVEIALTQVLQRPQLAGPAAESVGEAVGEEAEQKPPLRPEAAQPTSRLSISTTSRRGSRSLARSAVHRPL